MYGKLDNLLLFKVVIGFPFSFNISLMILLFLIWIWYILEQNEVTLSETDILGFLTFLRCDITPAVEERTFWIFELSTFIIGAASYTVVYLRQRKNDQLLMDKINRQIGLTT